MQLNAPDPSTFYAANIICLIEQFWVADQTKKRKKNHLSLGAKYPRPNPAAILCPTHAAAVIIQTHKQTIWPL